MAVLEQIAKTARTWLIISRHKTLALPRAPFRSYQLISGNQIYTNASNIWQPKFGPNLKAPYCMIPAMLAGLVGVGMVEVVQADANEITANSASSEASTNIGSIEETARKERQFIEELLRSKGVRYGSYPGFSVSVKGPRVSIKFQAPPACEVSQLIANLVSHLGLKVDEHGGGSDMLLRAWDSTVAWQLTLTRPGSQKDTGGSQEHSNMHAEDGELCIVIFRSLINSKSTEIEFIKQGHLSLKELEALVSVLQLAGGTSGQNNSLGKRSREGIIQTPSTEKSISSLESMGVRIYGVDEIHVDASNNVISWENIAGYDQQKREIEDMILLALHRPEIYDDIAHGTRCRFQSNRPRAVLFEGPPGTGKTSCARVIAKQAGVPLLYVPLEVVLSKYYGESERLLGKVFSLADDLPNGAIIFLDEVDSFATARDSEMHEATRRILSVILRQIDGFEQDKKVVVIAATNRKQDLDPALISRFDSMITFGLPDKKNRNEIAAQYAKQLTKTELNKFAEVTDGMSGRDIRDVCQQAERSWASKIIRGVVSTDGEQITLPPLQEYIDSAMTRQKTLLAITEQKLKESAARTKKAQLA